MAQQPYKGPTNTREGGVIDRGGGPGGDIYK